MKLTDQEMKEAEALAADSRCKSDIMNEDWTSYFAFLAGITAALSSDKLLARVRAEAKRELLQDMIHEFVMAEVDSSDEGLNEDANGYGIAARLCQEKIKELGDVNES